MLADYGADVIKIEKPGTGDLSRTAFPNDPAGLLGPSTARSTATSARSCSIPAAPRARRAVLKLVGTADVVVNNFRAGVMERLGFGWEDLSKLNPRLIYAVGTGFGLTGPYAHKGGQDVLAQAMSGVMHRRSDADLPLSIYLPHHLRGLLRWHAPRSGRAAGAAAARQNGQGPADQRLASRFDASRADAGAAAHMMRGREVNWGAMPLSGRFRDDGWRRRPRRRLQGAPAARHLDGARNRRPVAGSALRRSSGAGRQQAGAARNLPRPLRHEHHRALARPAGGAGPALRAGFARWRRRFRRADGDQRHGSRRRGRGGAREGRGIADPYGGGAGDDPDSAGPARTVHRSRASEIGMASRQAAEYGGCPSTSLSATLSPG